MIIKSRIKKFLLAGLLLAALPFGLYAQVPLTTAEQSDLEFMREEEKLARDVYDHLFGIWGTPVMGTIAKSEQQHMKAVLSLLNFYGINDPAAGNAAGVFTNTDLQQLYDDLVVQGEVSEVAALEVGIVIELVDIADLELTFANTSRANIIRVYNNLLRGSQNHLSAFTNNLELLGGGSSGGNQSGNSLSPGTSIYEPISQTLYIPALNVVPETGEILVYDVILRLVETLPQALVVETVTLTSKLPINEHASFDFSTGIIDIPDLAVGALSVSIDDIRYTATLELAEGVGAENIFLVTQVLMK